MKSASEEISLMASYVNNWLNANFFLSSIKQQPITVAERFEAYTVFARSEAGTVSSNPTQGTDVWYVCEFSVFVLSCV
jgi:hypothetical protein